MAKLIKLVALLFLVLFVVPFCHGQYVTITGTLQGSNGLAAKNYTIAFTPTQWFFIAGTGVAINTTSYCATSVDGTTVGLPNPLTASDVTTSFTGTLPAGNYYIEYTWFVGSTETLPSPEVQINLGSNGSLNVPPPSSGVPAGATGMRVYIGSTSGAETLQGATAGSATYVQSVPLASGATPPGANTTVCTQVANDAGWPTGTGYTVSLTDTSGNTLPGYPMVWQLLGPNTTINLSNGLPYYHGIVTYPVPILASPLNHAPQSISGPLSLTGYNLVNVGELGVGTALPGWGVDVEGTGNAGAVNAKSGYLLNGNGGSAGQCLISDGTYYDTPATCVTSLPTVYYQFVLNGSTAGSAVTQRDYLAFGTGTGLIAADIVGTGSNVSRTVVELNPVGGGTTLGSDPFPVVTAAGASAAQQYACSDATLGGVLFQSSGCGSTTIVNEDFSFTGCTVAASTDNQCSGTFSLPTAMPDATYFLTWGVNALGGSQNLVMTLNQPTLPVSPSVTVNYVLTCTFACTATVSPTIYVHAHHN